MFYPFPRQTQRSAPPPAPRLPAVVAAQPPAPMAWPQQCASPPAPTGWPQQRSDQPSGWPEEDGAASSLDDDGSEGGEELVFNDEFCTALSPRRAATRAEPAAVLQQAPQRATLLFLSGRMRPPAPRSERRGSGGSSKSCATGQGLRRCVRWRRPSTNASTASPRPTRRRCGRPCPFLDGVRTGSWIVEGY